MHRTRSRVLQRSAAALALAAGALALAWHDVLPGGWTLRGLVRPHAEREAEARAAHRSLRLAEFEREALAPSAVVFLGSSTIERFPLAEAFPGATTLNRGIGDEPLAQLIERIPRALPEAPRAWVVYAGSVDVRRLARPADAVARDAALLLDALAERAPSAPVVWLGVLPDRTMAPDVASRVAALNAALEALVTARGGVFVDTHRPPLVNAAGALPIAASVDELHLSEAGYAALARWLGDAVPALRTTTPREAPSKGLSGQ
ncbi:MAG: GDSL-type esterase/lipase family protein [Planctomycetota bacterium]